MAMTREQLLSEAKTLDPAERERLAEELLLSISGTTQREVDEAWLAEVRARDAAYRRGEIGSRPADEVVAEVLKDLGQ